MACFCFCALLAHYLKRLKEGMLSKRSGHYKWEKRQKELKRQKKKEEKRLKRLSGKKDDETPPTGTDELQDNPVEESAEEAGE